MQTVLYAVIVLGGIGLLIGVLLALIEKLLAVEEDPRLEKILAALPGVNCGACGFPGCAGYAAAIVKQGAAPNLCTPGGARTSAALAALLGVEAALAERRVARLLCRGGRQESSEKFEYRGIISCSALAIVAGGNKSCASGCLGMGDCVRSCQFGALTMGTNKLPVVDAEKCVACGRCLLACPRELFVLAPADKPVFVACRSRDNAQDTRKACKVGCIACRICVKKCPVNAITIVDNHAVIDPALCTSCGICVEACPRKIIVKAAPVAQSA